MLSQFTIVAPHKHVAFNTSPMTDTHSNLTWMWNREAIT